MSSWNATRTILHAGMTMLMCGAAIKALPAQYSGRVTAGGVPLPGVTVTATQNAKTFTVITDQQGLYQFPKVDVGEWHLHLEMQGFRAVEAAVIVPEDTPAAAVEMQILPLTDLLASARAVMPSAPAPTPVTTGFADKLEAKAKDSTHVPPPPQPETDGDADKSAEGMLINGSNNNAATSKYSLAQAFGTRRAGSKSLYTGSIGFQSSASPFDARPYSITGLQTDKASYSTFTGVATLGGPIRIPHWFYNGPNFFLAYQWTRNPEASILSGLVPTADQRSGDLGTSTHAVTPQAAALLALYPLPNLEGSTRYNYQTQVLNGTHTDSLQSRLDKSVGRRDQVYGQFAFRSTRANTENLFHFRDTTNTFGIDSDVNWSHRFPHQFFVEATYRFSRLSTNVKPFFANRTNISGNAGITGNLQDPTDYGPPDLNFSSGITSLTDGISAFDRNRTDGIGVSTTWTHRRHTVAWGGDFRRQEFNQLQQANPRGTFTFSGAATGSDIDDFLSGVPDASKIAFGNADKYFRQSASDLFVTDDWRVKPGLTLTTGLRWDYGAPITELKGRVVNLDVAPEFSAVQPVLGSNPIGALTGTHYPSSLIRTDFRNFQPRFGFAWRPLPATPLVIRGGYGIYVDTSVYLSAAGSMAQQSPLSKSVSVSNSTACALTLFNGFQNCAGTTSNTFAIDPNFRVGYAQTWKLSVQRDLPGSVVLTGTYLGAKGMHGPQEFLPNTDAGGTPTCASCPRGFLYRTSNGNSIRHAGEVQLRRRLRSGFTATLDYVYAHSIDNDAYLGGGATTTYNSALDPYNTPADTIAQNWRNLNAERSRSSFDQRHLLKFAFQYTTGSGMGGGTLMTGWRGRLLKQWTISSSLNAGSGLPQTPIASLQSISGTGFTGVLRPNRTAADVYAVSGGYHLNAEAYASPAAGQFGNAGRYSIEGPDAVTLDSSFARAFKLRDPLSLDVRVDATNLLNHVSFTGWNTITSSSTFGLPVSGRPMRSFQFSGRLRF